MDFCYFMMVEEGFNFSRLIKGLEKTPLGDFHLHDAALVFSEGKFVACKLDARGSITCI